VSRRDVLFLAHRIPYPPNKGDKTRAWHFLQRLAQTRHVHLGCFVDDIGDWAHVPFLKQVAAETCFVPLRPARALVRALPSLLTSLPLTIPYYRDRRLSAWVKELRRTCSPTVFVYSSCMAQYVMDWHDTPRLIDFVDVDSAKWGEYAARRSWPISMLYRRESRTLLRTERAIAREFDTSIFVSTPEAELFQQLAPESAGRIVSISNGIDAGEFLPAAPYPDPYAGKGVAALCFTGMMDYWPNVDAVTWFADAVFPAIRAIRPDATFWIVGARPGPAVHKLAQRPGIVVTGQVPDTRPYLAHASAVVAPLRIARGIQNKVLEGMAMARPVIISRQAFEGICAAAGRDLLVAGDAHEFVSAIQTVWTGQLSGDLGSRARAAVLRNHDWSQHFLELENALGRVEGQRPLPFESPRDSKSHLRA
jgi:sugar transferase (PEP-CTERM/EpsH1 system associated)